MAAPPRNSAEAIARLREFGYAFNAAGELRKINEVTGEIGDEPFKFEISENAVENQKHYDKLAEQIPEIIYALLEKNGLKRTYVPLEAPIERASFVFTQPEKLDNSKKLLVLIHGSGYVRAGQWARSLIINNSLNHGSQLPYIQRAQALGYDILVMNTNDNWRLINSKRKVIAGMEGPIEHAIYVWAKIVVPSNPQSIAIVAHSAGGPITIELLKKFTNFFNEKVFAIALTDSTQGSLRGQNIPYLRKVSCNWCSCNELLDTKLSMSEESMPRVSAGHPVHEWSSYAAMESVWKFVEEKYEQNVLNKQ